MQKDWFVIDKRSSQPWHLPRSLASANSHSYKVFNRKSKWILTLTSIMMSFHTTTVIIMEIGVFIWIMPIMIFIFSIPWFQNLPLTWWLQDYWWFQECLITEGLGRKKKRVLSRKLLNYNPKILATSMNGNAKFNLVVESILPRKWNDPPIRLVFRDHL